jgi:hypothetical protein
MLEDLEDQATSIALGVAGESAFAEANVATGNLGSDRAALEQEHGRAFTQEEHHEVPASHAAMDDFRAEMEDLFQKHQAELCAHLDAWMTGDRLRLAGRCCDSVTGRTVTGNTSSSRSDRSRSRGRLEPPGSVPVEAVEDGARNRAWSAPSVSAKAKSAPELKVPEGRDNKDSPIASPADTQLKKKSKSSASRNYLLSSARSVIVAHQTLVQRIVDSRIFEWTSFMLIILNGFLVGYETQYMASRAEDDARRNVPQEKGDSESILWLHALFCVAFAGELGLRWTAEGLRGFFQTRDLGWNVMDIFVVAVGAIDVIFELILFYSASGKENSFGEISVIRILRVIRLVRVARVIRVMRFFRELRMMVCAIMGSLKSLTWVVLVLCMTFYLFGISFVSAVTSHLETTEMRLAPENEALVEYFGTLPRSLLSLYMAMSGGRDWVHYYLALEILPPQYCFLFLTFLTFVLYAVINIAIGIFVESALSANVKDREVIVLEELSQKEQYMRSMRDVFEEMDIDNTGNITLQEFEEKLDDERVIAYFNWMKLDVSDARTLFRLIDYDLSNEVSITEFLEGFYKLQGESRALDMKLMIYEMKFLREMTTDLRDRMRSFESNLPLRKQNAIRVD